MDIQYNYKAYPQHKEGVFAITSDVYVSESGWLRKLESYKIIGEAEDLYVTHLIESGHGEWMGEKVIQYTYILPIGLHKSRLVAWVGEQLNLL